MDPAPIRDFLTDVFGDKDQAEYLLLWCLPSKRSAFFTDLDKAAAWAAAVGATQDVYVGVGTRHRDHGEHERGTTADVAAVFGLWADVDYDDPVHQKAAKGKLPPDENAARALLDAMPAAPTLVIHSGHGLQAWWLFAEPYAIEDAAERTMLTEISAAWQARLRDLADTRGGWTVDSVWDLSRVMRLPGTENRKSSPPVPVRVLADDGPRYGGPRDFLEWVERRPVKAPPQLAAGEGLVLREDAEPSMTLVEALKANSDEFRRTWEAKREDLPSQSEYDLALANFMVLAGWENQAIVDALIWHRRTHAAGPSRYKLREDYYAATIARARELGEREQQGTQREQAAQSYTGQEERNETIAKLRRILLFPLARWQQHGREKTRYSAICDDGRVVHFGVTKEISSQTAFFNRVYEEFGVRPEEGLKPKHWNRVLNMLGSIAEVIEAEDARRDAQVEDWIVGYLGGTVIGLDQDASTDDYGDAIGQYRPFARIGILHIHRDHFRKWVADQHGVRLEAVEVDDAFHSNRWERVTCWGRNRAGRVVKHRYWATPESAVFGKPPADRPPQPPQPL